MRIKGKILASPSSIGQISSTPLEMLKEVGYEVVVNPFGRKLTEDETILLGKDCIGIVAGVENLNSEVLKNLPNLKCISRVGVGIDNIDISYIKSRNIKLLNTPEGPTRAVAELTLGLTLSLLRKIPIAHSNLKNGVWKKETGNLLFEKKIGVIGLGRIGKSTAELFKSLGNPVYGYDLFPDEVWGAKNGIKLIGFEDIFETCDIVTIHVPGNNNNSPIITRKELSRLNSNSFLINVSRGGVVNEMDLYELLNAKEISGAAIDVFSQEPYSGKLCDLENVILTPHIGSYAKEGKLKMEIDAVQNLINFL